MRDLFAEDEVLPGAKVRGAGLERILIVGDWHTLYSAAYARRQDRVGASGFFIAWLAVVFAVGRSNSSSSRRQTQRVNVPDWFHQLTKQ